MSLTQVPKVAEYPNKDKTGGTRVVQYVIDKAKRLVLLPVT